MYQDSRLQCFLSLAHSGEGGGSSPEMLQTLRSTKKLPNDCFSKLFVRVSGCESLGCSGALISVFSSYARTEEDIVVPGLLLEHHFLVLSPLTRVMRRT